MATFGELIHGRKPDVAPFISTDPLEMLKKLLSGEIQDWPQITELSNLYQTYMMDAIGQAVPGFSDILKQGGADTQSLLGEAAPLIKGQIPEDVKNQVLRSSAYQNLQSGGGGQFLNSLQARDLGTTSLGLMQQGASMLGEGTNAAQRWQQMALGTILPPSSQMYSPEWFSTFMAQQNAAKQATKQLRYNTAAAPDPAWADRANLFASIIGMYAGGGMGGGLKATGSYDSTFGHSLGGGYASPGATGGYGQSMSGLQTPLNNPGFFSNFSQTYNNPGAPSTGFGGTMGNWAGSLFNQSARPGGFQWGNLFGGG